ncbi:hypothetical protein E4M02_07755 [Brevundimonas sp. S30B]|uniref:hypothetical protein n=1 Tax=unclassified Brevundimonas TaxID=2622653 RepID=UPI00107262AC|nr:MULTISPECIES: hypothetical protein [unclassified Brevundimonas]QBX37783.1 hypothetical protein E4M01_08385 [Brevundimonas sp. MF30-B]TFW02862.1 hypothetical protein E4M02_07755 [Brevundimonas sp. S30B]
METLLIILALGAIAVGVIVWISRRKPERDYGQRLEQDTAWNDPVHSDEQPTVDPIEPEMVDSDPPRPDRPGASRP